MAFSITKKIRGHTPAPPSVLGCFATSGKALRVFHIFLPLLRYCMSEISLITLNSTWQFCSRNKIPWNSWMFILLIIRTFVTKSQNLECKNYGTQSFCNAAVNMPVEYEAIIGVPVLRFTNSTHGGHIRNDTSEILSRVVASC